MRVQIGTEEYKSGLQKQSVVSMSSTKGTLEVETYVATTTSWLTDTSPSPSYASSSFRDHASM